MMSSTIEYGHSSTSYPERNADQADTEGGRTW